MKLNISGEPQDFNSPANLTALLLEIGIDPTKNGIAIAKNGNVIPKTKWQSEPVADGDSIEIVRASQGG